MRGIRMQAMKSVRVSLVCFAGLLTMSQAAWAQPGYKVSVVPLFLAPMDSSFARAINSKGWTATDLYVPVGGTASYRCKTNGCERIPALGLNHHGGTAVSGIDDVGNVVGTSPY